MIVAVQVSAAIMSNVKVEFIGCNSFPAAQIDNCYNKHLIKFVTMTANCGVIKMVCNNIVVVCL
jgi:hypothetical protein